MQGGNLQGNKVQTFKTLIYLQVEVRLNVLLRQADPDINSSSSRDVLRQKKQGPELSSPVLIRELSNGANTGLWFSLPTRNHQININAYNAIHWCFLWGELYEGVIPKEGTLSTIHSCTSPLSHSNCLGTMLFKALFYCSWLVTLLCSLGWQHKLSSICTSAWEFLLWGITAVHLPGPVVPKNSLILGFSLFKITGHLSAFWT